MAIYLTLNAALMNVVKEGCATKIGTFFVNVLQSSLFRAYKSYKNWTVTTTDKGITVKYVLVFLI